MDIMDDNEIVKQNSNKSIIILLVILIVIVLGLSGYLVYDKLISKEESKITDMQNQENIQTNTDMKNNINEDNNTNNSSNNYKTGDNINQQDLNTIGEYFNKSGANAFLVIPYNSISEINMKSLLKESNIGVDGQEYCDLISYCEGGLLRVDKGNLEEYLKKYTGKSISDFSMNSIYYNDDYKFYLVPSSGPSSLFGVTVTNGYIDNNGNYVIDYHIDAINNENREVLLQKVENSYHFIQNIIK